MSFARRFSEERRLARELQAAAARMKKFYEENLMKISVIASIPGYSVDIEEVESCDMRVCWVPKEMRFGKTEEIQFRIDVIRDLGFVVVKEDHTGSSYYVYFNVR